MRLRGQGPDYDSRWEEGDGAEEPESGGDLLQGVSMPMGGHRSATIKVAIAVAETIREAGAEGIPEGHLYVAFMAAADLGIGAFEQVVGVLVATGKVKRGPAHLLVWAGK